MTMPQPALAAGPVIQGQPVEPSGVTDPKSNAVAGIGELLKRLVTAPGVLHSENDVRDAMDKIDLFKRAFSTGSPIVADDHRAAVHYPAPAVPVVTSASPSYAGVPQIDYHQLAAAMLAIQKGQ